MELASSSPVRGGTVGCRWPLKAFAHKPILAVLEKFLQLLRVALVMNGGLWLPQGVAAPDGTHRPSRQKVCGVCVGGDFQQEEKEGVREVAWPLSVRLV